MSLAAITIRTGTIAAAIVMAGSSLAQEDNSGVGVNEADGSNPATNVICRQYPPPVGTRIGARNVCKTEMEWDQADAESRQVVERAQINKAHCPGLSSPC